ncbi:MAG TPA: multicopper oxidase domain-containing protein, partial [Candidatus Manganitrophaceae bacterium]|nr:multicopper oxidase domain-containing protein [Candidatus Manganitrophaceae bacterium]
MRIPERGKPSAVPAGAVRQDAGAEMMNRLTDRLDKEIENAGGRMGGFTKASDAHTQSQGVPLLISNEESVTAGGRCQANAPVKNFDISAINVEITISRFMDYFPGYLFVLTDELERVRAEEKKNKAARESDEPFPAAAVSTGLQGDAIQPLVIRANAGDCVRIILRNQTENDEPVSLHIHGSSFVVKATGQAATMTNKDSLVMPKKSQEFEWQIPGDATDTSHHFHSHAVRDQWSLGMFGSLIVEPRGSKYLSPWTGKEMKSGWMAIIEDPNGPDFREFAIFYHEIGDEVFRILDRKGEMLPQRDAFTDT